MDGDRKGEQRGYAQQIEAEVNVESTGNARVDDVLERIAEVCSETFPMHAMTALMISTAATLDLIEQLGGRTAVGLPTELVQIRALMGEVVPKLLQGISHGEMIWSQLRGDEH
jgi:hypothetical protein